MKKTFFITLPLLLLALTAIGQRAELHLVNNSTRNLTIKIMQKSSLAADTLYSNLSILPNKRTTEYFAKTGYYYLKIEASLRGKESVYSKGNPFQVYAGTDGYSVLTITYSITESNVPNVLDGKRISKSEFERN